MSTPSPERPSEDWLRELIEGHLPELRRRARRALGGRLGPVVESVDVAQSVALHAMQKLDGLEFRDERSLRNWVLTLAERKMIDWVRAGDADPVDGARAGAPADASDLVLRTHPTREPIASPSVQASATEDLERLRGAIASLPEEMREPLRLNRLEGLSYQEVAERTGLTYKQVRRLVGLGQLELARLLAPLDPG